MAAAAELSTGFDRPEMYKSALAGTVSFYQRHLFVSHGNALSWPSLVESAEVGGLPHALSAAVKARKRDMPNKIRLTVCEGSNSTDDGDILIFPDLVRYRGVSVSDAESFVEEVVVREQMWSKGVEEPLVGSHVFICAHGARDARCGSCGPVLVTTFRDEVESRGLSGRVSVNACSHIGGHKFAGNVIVYAASGGGSGPVSGHWYGYVTPEDVSLIVDQHIVRGEIVDKLWRGQMGLTEDQQRQSLASRQSADESSYACPCGVVGGVCGAKQQKRGPGGTNRSVAVAGGKGSNPAADVDADADAKEENGGQGRAGQAAAEAAAAFEEDSSRHKSNKRKSKVRKTVRFTQRNVMAAVLVLGVVTAIGVGFYVSSSCSSSSSSTTTIYS